MTVKPRPSIRRVAAKAGVSRTTVSHVLNGRDTEFSVKTRERVLEVVRQMQYVPVPQPTIQGRHVETRIIGIVFDYIDIQDTWGLPTYQGMCSAARGQSYDLLTMLRAPADWMLDNEELHFLDRRSDGLVFMVPKDRGRVLETLVQHAIPTVVCFLDDVPEGVATIVLDNAGAMRQGVEYLAARGHSQILHIAGIDSRSDFRHRREGYEAAMLAAGLTPRTIKLESIFDNIWCEALKKLLASREVTAVLCASDQYATEVLHLANAMGLSVPRDLSIVGMDDTNPARENDITTFSFSCEDVGALAVDAIARMVAGADCRLCSSVVPVSMVERGSVAAPRQRDNGVGQLRS